CASSPADGTEAAVWTSPREAPKCAPREVFRAPSRPQEACGGPLLTLPAAAQPRHAECATTPYLLLQFCKTLPLGSDTIAQTTLEPRRQTRSRRVCHLW